MKKSVKYILTVCVLVFAFAVSVFAAEGDFGFYDRDFDGEVKITDVLAVIRQLVNGDDDDITLIHAIRVLKIVTNSETVKLPIMSINYDEQTVSLVNGSETINMSFSQLGFDRLDNTMPYESGYATLTLPTPAKDYLKDFDVKNVYAVKLESRYFQDVLEATVDNAVAKLNGADYELPSASVISDGVFMMNASALRDFFEADTTWNEETKVISFTVLENTVEMTLDSAFVTVNGEDVVAPAPLVYIGTRLYVPAQFIAEALGATAAWDETTETMTIAKYTYPTLYAENKTTTVKAGEEFAITVYLRHNPGVAGFEYRIKYNSKVMSYLSGTGKISSMFSQLSSEAASNPVKFVAANLNLKNVVGDIVTAEITFKVADNAVAGMYELELNSFNAYTYDGGEIIPLKALVTSAYVIVE